MLECAACGQVLNKENGIVYYHFPKDPTLCRRWVWAVQSARRNWKCDDLTKAVLCSMHFDISCYNHHTSLSNLPGAICIGLKKTAVPNKFGSNLPPMNEEMETANGDKSGSTSPELSQVIPMETNGMPSDDSDVDIKPTLQQLEKSMVEYQTKEAGTTQPEENGSKKPSDGAEPAHDNRAQSDNCDVEMSGNLQQPGNGSSDQSEEGGTVPPLRIKLSGLVGQKNATKLSSVEAEPCKIGEGDSNDITLEIFEGSAVDTPPPEPEEGEGEQWFDRRTRVDHLLELAGTIDKEIERSRQRRCARGALRYSAFNMMLGKYLPHVSKYARKIKGGLLEESGWNIKHDGKEMFLKEQLIIPCLGSMHYFRRAECPWCKYCFMKMGDVVAHMCLSKKRAFENNRHKYSDVTFRPQASRHSDRIANHRMFRRRFTKVFKHRYPENEKNAVKSNDGAEFVDLTKRSPLFPPINARVIGTEAVSGWDMDMLIGDLELIETPEKMSPSKRPSTEKSPSVLGKKENSPLSKKKIKIKKQKKSEKQKKLSKIWKEVKKEELRRKKKAERLKEKNSLENAISLLSFVNSFKEGKEKKKTKTSGRNSEMANLDEKEKEQSFNTKESALHTSTFVDSPIPEPAVGWIKSEPVDYDDRVYPVRLIPSTLMQENMESGWVEESNGSSAQNYDGVIRENEVQSASNAFSVRELDMNYHSLAPEINAKSPTNAYSGEMGQGVSTLTSDLVSSDIAAVRQVGLTSEVGNAPGAIGAMQSEFGIGGTQGSSLEPSNCAESDRVNLSHVICNASPAIPSVVGSDNQSGIVISSVRSLSSASQNNLQESVDAHNRIVDTTNSSTDTPMEASVLAPNASMPRIALVTSLSPDILDVNGQIDDNNSAKDDSSGGQVNANLSEQNVQLRVGVNNIRSQISSATLMPGVQRTSIAHSNSLPVIAAPNMSHLPANGLDRISNASDDNYSTAPNLVRNHSHVLAVERNLSQSPSLENDSSLPTSLLTYVCGTCQTTLKADDFFSHQCSGTVATGDNGLNPVLLKNIKSEPPD